MNILSTYTFFKSLSCRSLIMLTCFMTAGLIGEKSIAQCAGGETELYLTINTDEWGYECYWQITPAGNNCNTGTIAEGGNLDQVGCGGAGDQDATTAEGYNNFDSVEEGPICLTIGSTYTLHFIDDYGDGGSDFVLNLFGFNMFTYQGTGEGGEFDFTVAQPLLYDAGGLQILSYGYVQQPNNLVRAKFFNYGSEVITDIELSYSVEGGSPVTGDISGLNVAPYTAFTVDHPLLWSASSDGDYELSAWISSINGNADMNTSNDVAVKQLIVGPGIPNILDQYMVSVPEPEAVVSTGVTNPRDLDFHPILTRKELWVVLKSTENSGGRTVKVSSAGESDQDELAQQDGNAWHFMSLPTGIAFSKNENFGTSPGVYDANHDGGSPFTGPALWSSDPAIYAQPSGGNGSHLDMLHESPYSMGIAWETENKFWVTCGDHEEIMSFDFQDDHGPGNDDHADGIIYKYPIPGYDEDPDHEVPDHLIFDHATGWLYVCNSQLNRVFRINTATGTPGDDEDPHEATAVYKFMDNFVWEEYITDGLDRPTGIDIVENRMIVSNYNTGDINLYDISGDTPILLTVIPTGSNGIMGIKVGPDGLIWYVNSVTDKVMRVAMSPAGVDENSTDFHFSMSPNPAKDILTIGYSHINNLINAEVQILDISGRVVMTLPMGANHSTQLDVTPLANGLYQVVLKNQDNFLASEKLIIER